MAFAITSNQVHHNHKHGKVHHNKTHAPNADTNKDVYTPGGITDLDKWQTQMKAWEAKVKLKNALLKANEQDDKNREKYGLPRVHGEVGTASIPSEPWMTRRS